jgi:hypothetical protein
MRKAAGQPITEGWSGWISAPFLAAGWSACNLQYAIDHPPGDHGQHRLSAKVRHPVGWLRWRLGLWLHEDGSAMKSVSQVRADARARGLAERERLRELTGAGSERFARLLDETADAITTTRRAARHMRWIQYATDADRKARRRGRPREGQRWQDGPKPGLVWAVPADLADRLYVLVHCFPGAPEGNYALDGEQK